MSDEQIDIFAAELRDVEPARERIVLDPGGEFIAARRADDRRAAPPSRTSERLASSPPRTLKSKRAK